MKLLMESTDQIVTLDGVECRIWNALTETNVQCFVFVHRVAVRDTDDQSAVSELLECPATEVKVIRQ